MYFQLPFCKTNEGKIKSIVNILEELTNKKFKFIYHWKTKHNAQIKRKEHCPNIDKKREITEHLLKNPRHKIEWEMITSAPHQHAEHP